MGLLPTVVGVDGSSASLDAVRWAVLDAELHNSGLIVVSSVPWPSGLTGIRILPEPATAQWRGETRRILDEALTAAERAMTGARTIGVDACLSDRPAVSTLLELSATSRMIVIGTSGLGGTDRRTLGSISYALSTHAHCPVTVVRAWPDDDRVQAADAVVVGVDGTMASDAAVALAFEEAAVRRAPLTAVHAWSDADLSIGIPVHGLEWPLNKAPTEDALTRILDEYSHQYPSVSVRRVVVRDRPVHALLDHAQGAQLLVVGSHGRGGFSGMMLGSASRSVLGRANCPVVIVPSSGRFIAREDSQVASAPSSR
ncbi:universal stress protein [Rhodococcus sp. H29-C3]|uniref:universal stress protein n=1 Tax=Rhodococcus sp. H29-C3 TaxID=3046307 RepID=UPI0024BAC74A|nr:universal stress protein [Rhodococcus sp. H29-C3]MDJ0359625.1 universal stress protein [Rhodococcus sp. H29-C3]